MGLTNKNNTGATQIPAADFLRITYPSTDLLKTLEAAGPNQGRPITLKGERGQGKSHLMAALYHALTDVPATQQWLDHWAGLLPNAKIGSIQFAAECTSSAKACTGNDTNSFGTCCSRTTLTAATAGGSGKVSAQKKPDMPSDEILLEMFRHTPTALILDEFQTWYDGLISTKQYPLRVWAFNFVQILSEIAKEHPDLLVLVVSVHNGNTDAYQQIQRVNPVIVDFKGPAGQETTGCTCCCIASLKTACRSAKARSQR